MSELKLPTYGGTVFVGRRLQPRHEAFAVGTKVALNPYSNTPLIIDTFQ